MTTKLLLFGLLLNLLIVKDALSVGVCYGQLGDNLPSPRDVVSLYQRTGITKMRIYDPNQPTLEALRGTNIELMIGVPNDALQSLNDQNAANTWVRNNIQRYSNVRFRYIAVGNEVDPNNGNSQYVRFVLPALQNIFNAVRNAGLGNQIKVSTATYSGLLGNSFPPSAGAFRDNVRGFIEPIVRFLAQNNQPMLANIYPYFSDPGRNLPYALFTASQPVVNDNGRQYSNLFDAILDAHYAAQGRLGGQNVEIVVSESGWPSSGGSVATVGNAGTYVRNLIAHVGGNAGTPLKPGRSIETYLFAMFDENRKGGNEEERHFGLFSPSQQAKYGQINFN
ncbi:glucan endo-1,3-beta-glucosidase-like isoform X1 [Bidens hawaiensis]|uniref:glucan endo-1,3-beta-glucosidase-like isoform X1 n=1 Tax=Bidens hawaiensis TaxID=980011 RepID=UPI00404B5C1F